MFENVIKGTLDAGHLRLVALLWRRVGRIGIDFGSGPVGSRGNSSAQPKCLLGGNHDDTLLRDLLADDLSVGIGRGNVSDSFNLSIIAVNHPSIGLVSSWTK